MATTKYILEQIKINGQIEDLIAKSNGENVKVSYNGSEMTLAQALANIFTSVTAAQTAEQVNALISAEINKLINGAPETYDTLKEIADYIEAHKSVETTLNAAIGNKLDKSAFDTFKGVVETLGALAEKDTVAESDLAPELASKINSASSGNHSHSNKTELDKIKDGDVDKWNAKADTTAATKSAAGLMSADDKKRLGAIGGVFYGTTPPDDMQNGDLFVRVVSEG